MKRLLYTILMVAVAALSGATIWGVQLTQETKQAEQTEDCCPKFELFSDFLSCHENSESGGMGYKGPADGDLFLSSCKNNTQNYIVSPTLGGFTYEWVVEGGTPSATSGDNINIVWDDGWQGKITVFIASEDGLCLDTIRAMVQLDDSPTAGFDISTETTVCRDQLIDFINTSEGANDYYWDFGDGSTSTLVNPSHSYSQAGVYTVTLVVRDKRMGERPSDKFGDCGCADTFEMQITVLPERGLRIESDCKVMLCFGDVATYFTPDNCDTYNWAVTGGTIVGSATGKEIEVVWDGSYPATVTLSGDCGGLCGDSTTIDVPVLYPNIDIEGPAKVCLNSTDNYSLPAMPGTLYTWTVTGPGNSIIGASINTASVNVHWGWQTGSYTLECVYINPHTGCQGVATMEVNVVPELYMSHSQMYCVGSSFNFGVPSGTASWTISPSTGFTPSTFADAANITGTWTEVGEYTIKAVPTNPDQFCNEFVEVVVKVLDLPTAEVASGDTLICPGNSYVYEGATNSESGWFVWLPEGGVITSYMGQQNDSVVIKWNPVGPYKLKVMFSNGACQSPMEIIEIDVLGAPEIEGNPNACMDEVAVYTTNSPAPEGGFEWSLNNSLGTIISGQGTNTIEVLWHGSQGNNTSELMLTTCGGSDLLNITVNIPSPVTLVEGGSFCDVNGKTLTAVPSDGTSYIWTLNGDTLAQTSAAINITEAGKYSVTVVDANGCTGKLTRIVNKEEIDLSAALSTTDKYIWGCEEDVNTTIHAIPALAELCYQWYRSNTSSGDGIPISGATSSSYTATMPGFYWAEISVCNTSCVERTDTLQVEKWGCDSVCDGIDDYDAFIINTDCNPITFTGSTNPTDALGSVKWYLGDGNIKYGTSITHNYRDTATYLVCAKFWSPEHCEVLVCKEVEVNIVSDFKFESDCDGVSFTNISKSRNPIVSYNWTFDGGTPATSNAENPHVVFAQPGVHMVTLTIDDGTCTSSYTRPVVTYGGLAEINVPDPLCVNTDAPFTAVGSEDLAYSWNFGDGFTSNLQNVTHAYQNAGTYTVTLTTMDVVGCEKIYTEVVTVNPAPVINIGGDLEICMNDSIEISGPAGFDSYQWYRNGNEIEDATSQNYFASSHGEYWVKASNGEGCSANSNHVNVNYKPSPIANIWLNDNMICSGELPLMLNNNDGGNTDYSYSWSLNGPAAGVFTTSFGSNVKLEIPDKTPGMYEIVLEVTDINSGCTAIDTKCFYLSESPTVTVEMPEGELCAGEIHTFVAHALPDISPQEYVYLWSNGHMGDTVRTGKPGPLFVTVLSPNGCAVREFVTNIVPLPDVSLAPVGCDTLCLTDTIYLPLPTPSNLAYEITWYDDNGTSVEMLGNNAELPLANLHPGIHNLYAEVSYPDGCSVRTGTYHVYVEDCDLPKVCEPCDDILDSAEVIYSDGFSVTFTIKTDVQEVRISFAENGCLTSQNQNIGSLQLQPSTGASGTCDGELIWKGTTPLAEGTYTVTLQSTMTVDGDNCFHLTLIDTDCMSCESVICAPGEASDSDDNGGDVPGGDDEDCDCNLAGEWTNLYMIPQKPGVSNISSQILCNTILNNVATNVPYVLSGMYNCFGDCISVKNEIVVFNQMNQIIYTREGANLNEVITFPAEGAYTVMLTATCGDKKCVCTFKVNASDNPEGGYGEDTSPPIGGTPGGIGGGGTPPVTPALPPELPAKIDSIVNTIIPKDFNGGILVAKDDSVIYEKYVSYKHEVNKHTAFDIASITKPFTAAAILKLMEDGKVDIDAPVKKYLPKFPYDDITVKMLLTHRSGLMDYLNFIDGSGWDKSINVTNNDLLDIIADNKGKVQINKPGTVYRYSNTNYSLLALIVEKASGKSYANYLDLTFFMPLGMKDSYVVDINNFARSTQSYYRNGTEYQLRYLDLIYGDKCIYSSTDDLKKWDTALRHGKVLSKQTMELAQRTIGEGTIAFNSSYTMGWKKIASSSGKEFLYHDGWWAGNRALLIRLVDENVVIVVLSNNNFTTIKDIRKLCDLFGDYRMSGRGVVNF